MDAYSIPVEDVPEAKRTIRESAEEFAEENKVCLGCGSYDCLWTFVPSDMTAGGVRMPLFEMDKQKGAVKLLQQVFLEAFNEVQPTSCFRCTKRSSS